MQNQHDSKKKSDADKLRIILKWFYATCIIVVLLDFVIHRHIYHPWESMALFYCVFGFAACVVLVLVSKWMRKPLMRSEDYYDGD